MRGEISPITSPLGGTDDQSGARVGSNEDLLTEILIRLPATSILCFKSVCKQWRLLLSHKHFTLRYDNNSLSKSPLGLFCCGYTKYEPVEKSLYVPFDVENPSTPLFGSRLDDYFNRPNVIIKQSCNGLLLCSVPYNGVSEYYVFNPTTRQLAFIPPVTGGHTRFMALAFHTHCVHYKVVCIRDLDPDKNLCQIQVYSSDSRTWKICSKSFFVETVVGVGGDPVYWNGAVHWAPVYKGKNFLYFKLDDEQLQPLPMPEAFEYDNILAMYFGESRGHLHLVFHTNSDDNILRVNVYEMLTHHSGWFVKYQVNLDALVGDFPCMIYHRPDLDDFWDVVDSYVRDFEVVDVVRGKKDEETFLVLSTPMKLIRYNVHDKSFKVLGSFKEGYVYVHRYIETLSLF